MARERTSASSSRRLNAEVRAIEPWFLNSGEEAMLAPGERSAGFSRMMVVRALDRRAAMASSTTLSSSRFESLSSRMCSGSMNFSASPFG